MKAMGFHRVVDYGEPIGWHCEKSGETFAHGAEHAMMCHRRDHVGAPLIPVYLPIPDGERPQTTWGETSGDDAVCLGDGFGNAEYIIGFETQLPYNRLSGRRCAHPDGDQWARWGALSSADKRDDPNDLVSAIRHVAEE